MLAFLLLSLAQGLAPAPPTRFDKLIALEIKAGDPLLAGHGRSQRVACALEFSGTLHVWTKAAGDLDLLLRVERPDGTLVTENADSGGGRTPYVLLAAQPGRRLELVIAAKSGEGLGRFELQLAAAPETEATRAAAQQAQDALAEIRKLKEAGGIGAARARAQQAIELVLATPGAGESDLACRALWELGFEGYALWILGPTRAAYEQVLRHSLRTLPDGHHDLQDARANVALVLGHLGDHTGARTLQQAALAACLCSLPADHPDLQDARTNLALTLMDLGDLAAARALQEQVLEVGTRTLPADDPRLQSARGFLGTTLNLMGELRAARVLQEQVLEVDSRTLPEDHPDLQAARADLALTIKELGDLARARELQEQVLEARLRTLPEDHLYLQRARAELAGTIKDQGDLGRARALEEQALEACLRTLPDDQPDLQASRLNLAATIAHMGDLAGARALQEQALAVYSRTLLDEHPNLQAARANLARTYVDLGEVEAAQALQQKVLEVDSRTLPADHHNLQSARASLARTLRLRGDPAGARALEQQVLEVRERTLPADHPDLQSARGNLALSLRALGDLAGARALQEQVLAVEARTLPDDHPDLQADRECLARTILRQLASDPRAGVAQDQRARCAELLRGLCRAQVHAARSALLCGSSREASERCAGLAQSLGTALSAASGLGLFEPLPELEREACVLSETTRGAAIVSAALVRRAARSAEYAQLRAGLKQASDELARLAHRGAGGESFDRARAAHDAAERALLALSAADLPGIEFDPERLAARLGERSAAVGYRRFVHWQLERDEQSVQLRPHAGLCAFVLRAAPKGERPGGALSSFVDLGPIAPIEAAARGWRDALGAGAERGRAARGPAVDAVRQHGAELRSLVLDPLLPALAGAERVVVALDDVLHLVPLDALPFGEGDERVGDRWRIETRDTLTELLLDAPAPDAKALVALGGASFNVPALPLTADEAAEVEDAQPLQIAGVLRGTAWERGFEPLASTAGEAHGVGALCRELLGETCPVVVLEKRKASRAALEQLAPKARFLHIATHGWFARESIRSWSDPEPLDKLTGLGHRMSGAEQVRGMSPLLLCGLALAGANLPEDELGRLPGLVTAEELSALDLSNCELAVLSACDTHVGEQRAGQGVASLQLALQMAGARSVITSLWKVPDEATKELMLDFYRRLWVERKPKWKALWEAKRRLREAKDEHGQPKYTTRDWAAWVLTGEPE